MLKKLVLTVVGSLFITIVSIVSINTLFADSITAEKKAKGPQDMISSASGNVQLRHYANKLGTSNSYQMITQTRANLTWGLLDDKVSTTLTLAVYKENDGTSELLQRRPQIFTEIYLFQSNYFDLTPYVDIRLKTPQRKFTTTMIGLMPILKTPTWELGGVKLNGNFWVSSYVALSSQKTNLPVEGKVDNQSRVQFGIVENPESQENEIEGKAKPSYEVVYTPMINFDMNNLVKGLSFNFMIEYYNDYDNKVKITEDNKKEDYYASTRETLTYYTLSYRINDKLTFTNQLITGHTGLYKEKISGVSLLGNYRLTNLAYLTYTLY